MEEKGINALPADILGIIFTMVIKSDVKKIDYCDWCNLPYYWIVKGPTATALKGVCRKWRRAALHHTVIGAMCNTTTFCFTPVNCMQSKNDYVLRQIRNTRQPLFFGRGAILAVTPLTISDEEDSTTEELY